MKTLVTGAAGFIGSSLVDGLLARGHEVVGVDNLSTGLLCNLKDAFNRNSPRGAFRHECMDIRSVEFVDLVKDSKPDRIFHLAAQVDVRASVQDPRSDALNNVLGTINVCEAARVAGVARILYAASGGSRYGSPTHLPVAENALPNPLSPYAVSKLAGEFYLQAYAQMYGMTAVALALPNVYGPRQSPHGEAGVVALFGAAFLSGRAVTIYGDGTSTRDYLYVGDVVEAFIRASEVPVSTNGVYNLGTGQQTSVVDLYDTMSTAAGRTTTVTYAPDRKGELKAIALDANKAYKEFQWSPTVGLKEGVLLTLEWLRANAAGPQRNPRLYKPLVSN